MKESLAELIEKALEDLGLPKVAFSLERPAEEGHGDWATNVALLCFGAHKKYQGKSFKKRVGRQPSGIGERKLTWSNPRALAEEIVKNIINHKSDIKYLENVEVAGPGFINFRLKTEYLLRQLEEVLKKEDFGKGAALKGQKIMVEYTDPNPFKEFHIGHLYSNVVGEALCRLFEASGATVWRADFFGDVGMHTAKAMYGLWRKFQIPNSKFQIDWRKFRVLGKKTLSERVKILGQAYALGAQAYEEDKQAVEEMKKMNLLAFVASQEYWKEEKGWEPRVDYRSHIGTIDEKELQEIKQLWVTGRTWSLEYFESIYERLGTKFDGYYPESLTGEWGYQVVMDGLKQGVFTKSDGAVVYKGEKKGLHTRVFINKLGLPTYETKDIGNPLMKYNDFKYDKSLIVTGNEIDDYFKVVIAAMKEVQPDLGNKTEHLGHGMVKLPEGKMSSRTGKILSGEWLLDEAKKAALKIMEQSSGATAASRSRLMQPVREPVALEDDKRDEGIVSRSSNDQVAEIVGMGAVKYALLRGNIGRDVAFDFSASVSFEGNSGPYVQYAFARATSVLERARGTGHVAGSQKDSYKLNSEELAVLRWLTRFPEIVETAALEYAPNQVASYLYELAGRFNTFYNKHSILGGAEEQHIANGTLHREESEKGESTISHELYAIRHFRLALTAGVARVLKTGLELLGIQAPEKM